MSNKNISKKINSKQSDTGKKNNTKNKILFDDQNILSKKLNKMFGQWYEADCCDT